MLSIKTTCSSDGESIIVKIYNCKQSLTDKFALGLRIGRVRVRVMVRSN